MEASIWQKIQQDFVSVIILQWKLLEPPPAHHFNWGTLLFLRALHPLSLSRGQPIFLLKKKKKKHHYFQGCTEISTAVPE